MVQKQVEKDRLQDSISRDREVCLDEVRNLPVGGGGLRQPAVDEAAVRAATVAIGSGRVECRMSHFG